MLRMSSAASRLRRLTASLLLTLTLAVGAAADSPLDLSTPAGLAPGAPAGSFALSDFEHVNPFNGNLNFSLPLLKIGGRGGAGYSITLPVEQRWTSDGVIGGGGFTPSFNFWDGIKPGYGPGVVQARKTSNGCDFGSGIYETDGATRLTFTAADGTEYELVDTIYNGQAASSFCNPNNFNGVGTTRGKVFVSRGAEAATFISDADIKDTTYGGSFVDYPTGLLMLRDGTRLRVEDGRVTTISDRNGNRITIQNSIYLTTVTDSLNRQVTVSHGAVNSQHGCGNPTPTHWCEKITYSGFGGAERSIYVFHNNLANALASGTIDTYHNLFPELTGSTVTQHDPPVVSSVVLPDGRSYQLRYNKYGELAKVTLPTGGVLTYEWGSGYPDGYHPSGTAGPESHIQRRVLKRRAFTADGAAPASVTSFGRFEGDPWTCADGSVLVRQHDTDAAETVLSQSRHHFIGAPLCYLNRPQFYLHPLKEGREKQTDGYDGAGGWLRSVVNTYHPADIPVVVETLTTLKESRSGLINTRASISAWHEAKS